VSPDISSSIIPSERRSRGAIGMAIALSIIALWSISYLALLSLDLREIWSGLIPIAILWQTFLYTGLFITTHDSLHGCYHEEHHEHPRVPWWQLPSVYRDDRPPLL
jgi:fatty acid desaturase